ARVTAGGPVACTAGVARLRALRAPGEIARRTAITCGRGDAGLTAEALARWLRRGAGSAARASVAAVEQRVGQVFLRAGTAAASAARGDGERHVVAQDGGRATAPTARAGDQALVAVT